MLLGNDNTTTHSTTHLAISRSSATFETIKAPIVIGTPLALWEMLKVSNDESLLNVNYLVLDEVDRLLKVLGTLFT